MHNNIIPIISIIYTQVSLYNPRQLIPIIQDNET